MIALRLVGRALGLHQLFEREQPAVGRRVFVKEDLLCSVTGCHVQERIHPLDRLARDEHAAIEPFRIGFALAQVANDLGPQRPRWVAEQTELLDDLRCGARGRFRFCFRRARAASPLPAAPRAHLPGRLAAMNEVEHADHLVWRQAAQDRQADISVAFECAQHQGDDEHLLVVAHVAVVVVPCRQPHVEPRIELDQIPMDRVDLIELAMRRREQRVQDFQPQVLFAGCHDVTSFMLMAPADSRS